MKIAISCDSACDLPLEKIQKYDIQVLPYSVILGDEEHFDGIDISDEQIFEYVHRTGQLPKTAAVNVVTYTEYFEKILKNYDAIIHFSLSGNITSSTNNAITASNNFKSGNVKVIDSKNLSSGIALLVLSAIDKISEGKTFKEVIEETEKLKPLVQASFVVDTLKYLHKGGRCSTLSLLGANMLAIHPRISLKDGSMIVTKKYMGKLNIVIDKYINDIFMENNPDKTRCFCTHSGPMEISSSICSKLKDMGFKEVYDCRASSTISAHCGPNTLGVLFINKI